MRRKHFALVAAFVTLVLVAGLWSEDAPPAPTPATSAPAGRPPDTPDQGLAERARRLHYRSIVFDAHADTILRAVDFGEDLGVRADHGHIDLPRMVEGGLDMQLFTAWVSPDYQKEAGRAKARALRMIDAIQGMVADHPDKIGLAHTVKEARAIHAAHKLVAFIGIEGGAAIEDDLNALRMFHDRGVRLMTLTWWNNTGWADGSGDKPRWHGLNDLGRNVVREMNRLGMVVDVSHASDETFFDVLETTTKPVVASHSNTRVLARHHRNLSDDMLRALAKNGGVIGVNYYSEFVDAEFARKVNALEQELKPKIDAISRKYQADPERARRERWALLETAMASLPPVSLDRLVDHIDHVVEVTGVDHVGLGSDFDGFSVGVRELSDCTKLPLITQKLLERGYSDGDVAKILGLNFLRVFEANIGE